MGRRGKESRKPKGDFHDPAGRSVGAVMPLMEFCLHIYFIPIKSILHSACPDMLDFILFVSIPGLSPVYSGIKLGIVRTGRAKYYSK